MPTRQELANAIRALSMDAVQKANSGHPGMPMGMADIAEVLWNDFFQHNPNNPHWINRDRFILSNGHGCMLQYALLHLSGYELTIEDLKQFRQLHSKTPGHPEIHETPGVETTTGPLGQGLANAVGMAIVEKHLATMFNRPNFPIIDHHTYVTVGDGCLMEGISHEVCSIAGTLGLGKLIVLYDDNQISIDGNVGGWFSDNTPQRFAAYNWHVIPNVNGHDSEAIKKALTEARSVTDQPSIICYKTIIGCGAPNRQGDAEAHGSPLGEKEIQATREKLAWHFPPFEIPAEYYAAWDAKKRGDKLQQTWENLFINYASEYPELAHELQRRLAQQLPEDFLKQAESLLQQCQLEKVTMATRKASQLCLNRFATILPELMGGSADLTSSNLTRWDGAETFTKQTPGGQYIHYGVREFGMSAMMNGMALHGGVLPFGGTFLTFSDYAKNAVRLSALMQQRCIFVYTHDSIGLGEDGPTHQPIEHIASLRLIPQLSVWRPCDTAETAAAWQAAITHQGPTCLLLSRQNLNHQERDEKALHQIQRGGYTLSESAGLPDIIFIATGSEINLAMLAAKQLLELNIHVRVVSMPSVDTFLRQNESYRESVLPKKITARLAIEAGVPDYWYRFVGAQGKVVGINHFGASAPLQEVYAECGITVENICQQAEEILKNIAAKV